MKLKPKLKPERKKHKPNLQQSASRQFSAIIATPIGKVGFRVINGKLVSVELNPPSPGALFTLGKGRGEGIISAIQNYFSNPKYKFKLPILLHGTVLQQKIWRELQNIPSGKVMTYGEIAKKVGTSPRVVGNACRRNPLPLVIPCHRVVAINGLGGFAGKTCGKTLAIKQWLLKFEGASFIVA